MIENEAGSEDTNRGDSGDAARGEVGDVSEGGSREPDNKVSEGSGFARIFTLKQNIVD